MGKTHSSWDRKGDRSPAKRGPVSVMKPAKSHPLSSLPPPNPRGFQRLLKNMEMKSGPAEI